MNRTRYLPPSLLLTLAMTAPACTFDAELGGQAGLGLAEEDTGGDEAQDDGHGEGHDEDQGEAEEGSAGDDEGGTGDGEGGSGSGDGGSGDGGEAESGGANDGGDEGEGGLPSLYGEIDLLIVIDGSMSMLTEQLKLSLALPQFFADLGETMPEVSFHVGVISSGDALFNGVGLDLLPCLSGAEDFVEFSGTLSAQQLVELTCLTEVGLNVDAAEKPMESMLSALAEAEGGLNGDFLRADALLGVIVVTDEDDEVDGGSIGDPLDWAEELTELAGGDVDALATFMLMGQAEPNACLPLDPNLLDPNVDLLVEAEPAVRLGAFAELLPGVDEDVCLPTYASFFAGVTSALAAQVE
ncbi:hypothetical protein PPSIR1_20204 [Plesiocystis pacifica SIR-1]|uniref:VWFA domain-containing protein n=1 Tax=Plesiocystis pacifica SIR-1 TaxID=391625 RepID=A6G217_9BACT|nr:hypothetical protein [Plesiocystis pacifica]EDM79986.1 hypothetical protein PPSIR1_20204 [Plesiocystis pacifica SIR-1]